VRRAAPDTRRKRERPESEVRKAVADSKNLPERPDNQTLLKLYALFKQASTGDVEGKRPGFTDMGGRAKWDAWNEIKGTSKDDATKQYIALVDDLKS
jgi:acyl-CoA-binding protein